MKNLELIEKTCEEIEKNFPYLLATPYSFDEENDNYKLKTMSHLDGLITLLDDKLKYVGRIGFKVLECKFALAAFDELEICEREKDVMMLDNIIYVCYKDGKIHSTYWSSGMYNFGENNNNNLENYGKGI